MTDEQALKSIIEDGINLGAGDYVEFEALLLAKEALEKRIPKIHVSHDNCGNKCASLRCPSCFEVASGKYCENCGQAIDWSKEKRKALSEV